MRNRKIVVISGIVILILSIFGVIYYGINSSGGNIKNTEKVENIELEYQESIREILNFLSSIAGVQAKSIEIINDPIGFKGELFVPSKSILNGINYFLESTENNKMRDLDITVENDTINIYVLYKVNRFIKTPIEVKVRPTLNENKDLVIYVDNVKFLDLKIANWIVNIALNSFVKDWFPNDGDFHVEFNKNNVVISKENFKAVKLKNISLNNNGINIDAIIDLEEI